jgi:hypothetical protein
MLASFGTVLRQLTPPNLKELKENLLLYITPDFLWRM